MAWLTGVAMSAALGGLFLATPAAAADGPAQRHCIGNVESGKTQCFATFTEVTKALSGGRVSIADPSSLTEADAQRIAAKPGTAVPQDATAAAATATAATYLLSIWWDGGNFTGSTFTAYASGPCISNSNYEWHFAVMPSGWNDRISSLRGYSNCGLEVFEHGYFGGAHSGHWLSADSTGLGVLNNKISSVQYW